MGLRALFVLLCLLPWPDVAVATVPVEPGEIVRQMLVRYERMETFSAEVRVVSQMADDPQSHRFEATGSIRLGRPDQFHITFTTQSPGGALREGVLWSSAEGPYLRVNDRYMKLAENRNAFAITAGITRGVTQTLPFLFFPSLAPGAGLGNFTDLRLLRREEVDGQLCYVLAGASSQSDFSAETLYWISEPGHLLIRQSTTIRVGKAESQSTATYSAIQVDAKLEPRDFVAAIPEGAIPGDWSALTAFSASTKVVPPDLLEVWLCKVRKDVPDEAADRLLAKALEIPGIQAAALVASLPERVHPPTESWVVPMYDKTATPSVRATPRLVSPGYFQMIDLTLVRGRPLTDRDDLDSPPVAVVSSALAKKAWPGVDPIGKQFSLSGDPSMGRLTVVGVVLDLADSELQRAGELMVYRPIAQVWSIESFVLLVRTEDPHQVAPQLRELIDRGFGELRSNGIREISSARR